MTPRVQLRPARLEDAQEIVGILAQDELGGHGDQWSEATAPGYCRAVNAILADPSALLLVAQAEHGAILGVAHAVRMAGLSDGGASLVQLVALFVGRAARGQRVGQQLLVNVEDWAQAQGARFVTLVSNKARGDANRFYRTHGYDQRHEGFKKDLGLKKDLA